MKEYWNLCVCVNGGGYNIAAKELNSELIWAKHVRKITICCTVVYKKKR